MMMTMTFLANKENVIHSTHLCPHCTTQSCTTAIIVIILTGGEGVGCVGESQRSDPRSMSEHQ